MNTLKVNFLARKRKVTLLNFTKISATGNDFVVIDNRKSGFSPEPAVIQKICARRTGVGADGILLLEESEACNFSMRYFNADGSEGELCGNGARAIALFAYLKGAASKKMLFESKSGTHRAEIGENEVKVEMPSPKNIRWDLHLSENFGHTSVGFVEIGVPHFVVQVPKVKEVNVTEEGRALRYHQTFPAGTNVDFVEFVDRHTLRMRTYERGVEDETLACGTGATAVSLLNFLKEKVESPVTVLVPGGILKIEFSPDLRNIFLSGAVQPIFSGILFMEHESWMNLKQLEKNFHTPKK